MAAAMHKSGAAIGRAPLRVGRAAAGAQIRAPIAAAFRTPAASPFAGGARPFGFGGIQQQQQRQQRTVVARGLFGLGVPELVVIAGVAALIFGPSKLPELGKGLGKTVKSFQTAAKEFESELKTAAAADEDGKKPADGADAKKPE